MTRECATCETECETVLVPAELSEYASAQAISYCSQCLAVEPTDTVTATDSPSMTAIHPRFPSGPNGVGLLLLVEKLDSLALNRQAIESLCSYLESNGLDLFLVLERLCESPEIEPQIDLSRRRTQLEQLLSQGEQ